MKVLYRCIIFQTVVRAMSELKPPAEVADPQNKGRVKYLLEMVAKPDFNDYTPVSQCTGSSFFYVHVCLKRFQWSMIDKTHKALFQFHCCNDTS